MIVSLKLEIIHKTTVKITNEFYKFQFKLTINMNPKIRMKNNVMESVEFIPP